MNTEADDLGNGVFLVLEISGFQEINITFGRAGADELIKHVAKRAQSALRVADILFRGAGNQFVAFLGATDRKTAESVVESIRNNITDFGLSLGGTPVFLQIDVTTFILPKDTSSLREALSLNRGPSLGLPKSSNSLVH